MIQNNLVIKENRFMSDEKIMLLNIMDSLKRLGVNGKILDEILERAKWEKGKQLEGLAKRLIPIRNQFSEESFGFESIQTLINELNGGVDNVNG